jgi:DNA-binding transcriptional MocR family regulator
MTYQLPTYRQILYGWNVKPTAKVVALVLRDFADKQMDEESPAPGKVTISIGKLAKITGASEDGVNGALDELQSRGFVESDRPGPDKNKRKASDKQKSAYHYRLHRGASKYYK